MSQDINIDSVNVKEAEFKDSERVTCHLCRKSFKNNDGFEIHLLRQHSLSSEKLEKLDYVCTLCPKSYAHAGSLRQHVDIVHLNKGYKCIRCGKSFKTPSLRNNHQEKCKVDVQYVEAIAAKENAGDISGVPLNKASKKTCTRCGRFFDRPDRCKRHQETCKFDVQYVEAIAAKENEGDISGVVPLNKASNKTCTLCGRIFDRPNKCKRHQEKCKGVNKDVKVIATEDNAEDIDINKSSEHTCTLCGQGFDHPEKRNKHEEKCKDDDQDVKIIVTKDNVLVSFKIESLQCPVQNNVENGIPMNNIEGEEISLDNVQDS